MQGSLNGHKPMIPGEPVGIAVLGAGPAGLTAAYALARSDASGAVFEADGVVGGIARTVEFDGYRFDLGGHRFFTKNKFVDGLWHEMLGDEFLLRPRLSRIYYHGKYMSYPLEARDVVKRLGLVESARCVLSYLWTVSRPKRPAATFEEWVTARFGRRLYDVFFRSYTQKVWGIPGSEIRSLWAAQRIKDFSLVRAAVSMLGIRRKTVATLIEEFHYPRRGPGQMWEAFRDYVEERDVPVKLNHRCIALTHANGRIRTARFHANGRLIEHPVEGVVSSIPLRELVLSLDPPAPPEVQEAAKSLRYRNLCLVAVITTEPEPFPDNWIYLHDPSTRAGRVQNFGAWSQDMVAPGGTCLGVEYFCFEDDEIWQMSEEDAVALATDELAQIGLIDPARVVSGAKVLVPKAYPMYDRTYEEAVALIRTYLSGFENLEPCGRNGLHRYNNQDHSMLTGAFAALNLIDGRDRDVWSINLDDEYLEEGDLTDALALPDASLLGLDPVRPVPAHL